MFASLEFVTTFATAFEKCEVLYHVNESFGGRRPLANNERARKVKTEIFQKKAKFLRKNLQD